MVLAWWSWDTVTTEILVENLDVKILFPNLEKFGESFKLKNLKFLETDK